MAPVRDFEFCSFLSLPFLTLSLPPIANIVCRVVKNKLFTHIVALFKLQVRNTPKSIIEGHLISNGGIKHLFQAFGDLVMLFIEVKFILKTGKEYLDAVAQMIAEALGKSSPPIFLLSLTLFLIACDHINSNRDLRGTVYGVLCDGTTFEFFMYCPDSNPRLSMGYFPFLASRTQLGQHLKLADLRKESVDAFLLSARQICESLFHVLLLGYRNALQAYYDRSMKRAKESGQPHGSTPK